MGNLRPWLWSKDLRLNTSSKDKNPTSACTGRRYQLRGEKKEQESEERAVIAVGEESGLEPKMTTAKMHRPPPFSSILMWSS
jgi:hypothetical protein